MKSDHRSKFSNLSNWKEEAWKNQGFNGIRTRDLRDTGAMLYQLSFDLQPQFKYMIYFIYTSHQTEVLLIKYCLCAGGREVERCWFMAKYYWRCWMPWLLSTLIWKERPGLVPCYLLWRYISIWILLAMSALCKNVRLKRTESKFWNPVWASAFQFSVTPLKNYLP